MATDVGRAFDGAAAGKSKATFSDRHVGLPLGVVSQVGLVLAHGGIVGYFLWDWSACRSSSVTSYDRCQRPLHQSVVVCSSLASDGGRDCAKQM